MQLPKDLIGTILVTFIAAGISFLAPYISIVILTVMLVYLSYSSYQKRLNTEAEKISVRDYLVADTVLLINNHGIIQDCNNQIFPMFGFTRKETIGKPIEFLMDPSLQAKHVNLRDLFFITSGSRRMQNRVWAVHKKGYRVHIEVYLEITSIGSQANVICSIRNIEAFWQREKDLLLENQILRSSQEGSIGIVQSTPDGQIILANTYLSKFLAYSADELKSMNIKDLVHSGNLEDFSRATLNLKDGADGSDSINVQLINSSGHLVAANVRMALIKTHNDDFISWTITDRTTEDALQRKANNLTTELESIIDNLPGKIAIWVAAPGMSNIFRTNELFHTMWGVSKADVQSNPQGFLSKIKDSDESKVMTIYQGHLRSGWQLDYQMTSDTGIEYQVSETAKLISKENEASALICYQQFTRI